MQIRLGVRYLKDVLRMKFPELRARAAAAEAEARQRQERAQRIVQGKYEDIKGGYEEAVAEITATLEQMAQCLDLLRADGGAATAAAPKEAPAQPTAAAAADDDAVEWEEAAPAAEPGQLTISFCGPVQPCGCTEHASWETAYFRGEG